jgi:hypothetical protein
MATLMKGKPNVTAMLCLTFYSQFQGIILLIYCFNMTASAISNLRSRNQHIQEAKEFGKFLQKEVKFPKDLAVTNLSKNQFQPKPLDGDYYYNFVKEDSLHISDDGMVLSKATSSQ